MHISPIGHAVLSLRCQKVLYLPCVPIAMLDLVILPLRIFTRRSLITHAPFLSLSLSYLRSFPLATCEA